MDRYRVLLDEFLRVPKPPVRRRTFMEIAGYPHYENVCSNIIAHFADPEAGHGMGDLILSSLAAAAGADLAFSGVTIDREVVTESGRRIDILIEADDVVVAVENKIFADLYNDLPDYLSHIDKLAGGTKKTLGIVLQLRPSSSSPAPFVSVTYTDWFAGLLRQLGTASLGADLRQYALLIEFIESVQNLSSSSTMNDAFLLLLKDRSGDVTAFLAEIDRIQRDMRNKVKRLGGLIELPAGVTQGLWRERSQLFDILVHDVQQPGGQRIAVDCIIRPTGWEVVVFNRRGAGSSIPELLQRAGYSSTPWPQNASRSSIDGLKFEYAEDLQVREALQRLLIALAAVHDSPLPPGAKSQL